VRVECSLRLGGSAASRTLEVVGGDDRLTLPAGVSPVVWAAWWWCAGVVCEVPQTRYATVEGGGQVAYQAGGESPVDVLVTAPSIFPVDMRWEEPRVARFLDRLSSFCRHVWFDPRGTGASDSIPHEEGRMTDSYVDDMLAVVDDVGCEPVAILGLSFPVGVLFAATHPDRTTALVLADTSARPHRADDYPAGWPRQGD
jgi:pimeloyl-ACP methyl ester carboxylesterase